MSSILVTDVKTQISYIETFIIWIIFAIIIIFLSLSINCINGLFSKKLPILYSIRRASLYCEACLLAKTLPDADYMILSRKVKILHRHTFCLSNLHIWFHPCTTFYVIVEYWTALDMYGPYQTVFERCRISAYILNGNTRII